jgi:excinuclease ABC subunit C
MEPSPPQSLEEQIQSLPLSPGVYLMKDQEGTVLYVGKAKNLRNRVRTYFGKSGDTRFSLRFLMPKVHQVETLLTDTEKEALILENTLIKKFKPRHNINFKDDKSYFNLKFSLDEEFPRPSLVRKVKKDGAQYFGPYASSAAVKETLNLLRGMFPLRTCSQASFKNRSRPCLNYQIRKCLAPCCGLISKEKYAEVVQEVLLFLEGKNTQLVRLLQERMALASEVLRFEEAACIRDQIQAVKQTLEKQKTVTQDLTDQDVFAFYRQGNTWEFQVLFFRRGLLVGNKSFHFSRVGLPDEETLSAFVRQYYAEDRYIPREVLLPLVVEDESLLAEWLSEKRGGRVEILSPQKGPKRHLVEMARKNAENTFHKKVDDQEIISQTLKEVKERLRLRTPPHRVECFDISNLFGTLAVGSMVSFLDGKPDRCHYRHFKVHAPSFPDDYAMMYEVLKRRYSKLETEKEIPDLLIVDGGKGQLNVALAVLGELGLSGVSAIGLAKDKDTGLQKIGGKTSDKAYLPNVKDPILLPSHSASLRFLQQIRDEAHRFAIRYHKKLRGKQGLQTILDEVSGIGEVKKKALFRNFGSLQRIREASVEALGNVESMTQKDAQRVFDFFHPSLPSSLPAGKKVEG